ncbi:MAG TPA: DUF664 domain-containing protein [Acidimicrobiales bacterium]|nr:DUF664 domain-containing protein [Acidimicrobiales bacterium]
MECSDVLLDAFGRVRQAVDHVLAGLSAAQLTVRLDPNANTIGWLVWHLTRVQDDHVAGVAGVEQVWTSEGWADRFALPFARGDIGYGQGPDDVAAVRVGPDLLAGYHAAVHRQTEQYLRALTAADLDRIVDESWDPPVTLGVRLVSVVADDLQHVGQAAFVRGVIEGGRYRPA